VQGPRGIGIGVHYLSRHLRSAARLGLTVHRARQLVLKMMDRADTILTMDVSALDVLREVCGESNRPKLAQDLGDRDMPDLNRQGPRNAQRVCRPCRAGKGSLCPPASPVSG
jgi:protein-tyrosine-phosphatase